MNFRGVDNYYSADSRPSQSLTEPPINTTVQIGKPALTYATVAYPLASLTRTVSSYESLAIANELLLHAVITCELFAIASSLHLT